VKKILCLAFLLLVLNAAADDIDENIIMTTAQGERVVTETSVRGYDPNINDETYRREAIYSWILLNDSKRINGISPSQVKLVNVVADNRTLANASNAIDNRTITVTGFCLIRDDIFIERQRGALKVDCQTNIGGVTMFANLTSVNVQKSLIVDPIYIEYRGGRYRVENSIVTNEARTSYNVATFVNDRKLAEIGWATLGVSSDEIKASSNQYLKELEESRRSEQLAYADVPVGSGNSSYAQTVELTNVERPRASDYIIGAGINIVASAVKSTAEIFKRDLPYLYEIVGGTKIYVDMQVKVKGERVE
jgi:hypothetical protein